LEIELLPNNTKKVFCLLKIMHFLSVCDGCYGTITRQQPSNTILVIASQGASTSPPKGKTALKTTKKILNNTKKVFCLLKITHFLSVCDGCYGNINPPLNRQTIHYA
jgi:hypothetical protein